MGVCKLRHVEVGGRRFRPSVLRSPWRCMSAASEKALNDSCCVIEDSSLVAGLDLAMPKLGRKLEGDKQYSRSGNLLPTYVVTESQTHATESHAKPQRVTGPHVLCGLQWAKPVMMVSHYCTQTNVKQHKQYANSTSSFFLWEQKIICLTQNIQQFHL